MTFSDVLDVFRSLLIDIETYRVCLLHVSEEKLQNSMRGIKTYLRENETSWEEISDEMKLDSSCIKTKCEKL